MTPKAPRTCTECTDKHQARGYCWKHLQRWYRHGSKHHRNPRGVSGLTRYGSCLREPHDVGSDRSPLPANEQ